MSPNQAFGLAPAECAHRRDHAAVVLEVVVGVEDVVLAVVLVLHRDLDRGEAAAHGVGRGRPVTITSVREARPREIHLGEIGVGTPRTLFDHREDAGSVASWRRTVEASVVAARDTHRIQLGGLVERGRPDAPRRRRGRSTCGNASRKKPLMRSVTSTLAGRVRREGSLRGR